MLTTLFSTSDKVAERELILRPNDDMSDSIIVRRPSVEKVTAETDLFEQARKIYSRGRRRYPRRASRIL